MEVMHGKLMVFRFAVLLIRKYFMKALQRKISLVSILLMIYSLGIAQQSIELTFSGNYYGEYIDLDSILVKNMSRSCDTVLYPPDTSLVLFYTVGIIEIIKNSFSISQNYPNPAVNGNTSFDILMPKNGQITFQLFDLKSNTSVKYSNIIEQGIYTFKVLNLNNGPYILTATTDNIFESIKIMSFNYNKKNATEIVLSSYEKLSPKLKTANTNIGFEFELGVTLRYVGFSKTPDIVNGSDVIESNPQSDTVVIFSIIEGFPCQGFEAINYGGYLYPTVQINNRCWLKKNINNGLMIDGNTNMTDNGIIEKYCYNNKPENCDTYGGLYQWDELMQYTTQGGAQGICPNEWHVADTNDFNDLTVNNSSNELKERGTLHWNSGNGGNNLTGFTALPAGYRDYNGSFDMIFEGADFYLSSEYFQLPGMVWYKSLYYASSWIVGGAAYRIHGLSVRCVKD